MPVMEGKAAIFKKYANIDAYPLCIQASGVEELVRFCRAVAPSFGGLNLEDIKAPICFDLLEQLERSCQIPVFHDDQDGTAIVTLAALINACRVTGKVMPELKVVVNGSGAAGIAITKLLLYQGVRQVVLLDSQGAIYKGRPAMNSYKQAIAAKTNSAKLKGGLTEVLPGMDVFVGVSKGGVLTANMVKSMAEDPIILAMANPDPEIEPKAAKQAGAAVVGTGRSDYPNQINNALVFPGVFRGLLDGRINLISAKVKTAAALALAYTIHPNANRILPNISNKKIVPAIAKAIKAKQS
jgi:malate dehydrogenase (oxaloacetate-decarboxylating)